jgi:geranylgeranyl pyrophosphate synthase
MGFNKYWQVEIESICNEHLKSFDYAREYLLHPGKRIRPNLFMDLVADKGKLTESSYEIAVAIEMLHLYFLVHDDIMDDDQIRREIRTIHSHYGEIFGYLKGNGIGIMIGNLLFSRAIRLLLTNVSNREATRMMFEVFDITAQGQLDEYLIRPEEFPTLDQLLMYYEEKTALYSIYLPLALAYYECTNENMVREDYLRKLRDFSKNLGVAFQVHDDLLEFNLEKLRSEEVVCRDVIRGKVTPILLYILERTEKGTREEWFEQWQEGDLSKESHDQILEAGEKLEVVKYAKTLINQHADRAWELAKDLGIDELATIVNLKELLQS